MENERPLEAARERIDIRKREETQPTKIEDTEVILPEFENLPIVIFAEENSINRVPTHIKDLLGDIQETIEEREGISFNAKHEYNFLTPDPKKVLRLLDAGKDPITSIKFSFEATIIEKGLVHERIVFGPKSPIEQKNPDIIYKIFFAMTYNHKDKTIEWIMGDIDGPEFKEEPENKDNVYRLTAHDPYVKGSIKYSEENIPALAEDLVTQIDSGRYKYQVREFPTIQLQKD
ncbi:MAG: hypothetical protein ABSC49_03930 [Candidatus Microgenomates bacterium]|jgi:hypothetical protein